MKIEKIKPIPKYIIALIKKADKQNNISVPGHTRFYSYLTKNDGELVKIVLLHCNFYQYFLIMPLTEHLCLTSVTYNNNSAVLSFYTRCLVMTSRTDERHSVRIRFQNSASFSRDT